MNRLLRRSRLENPAKRSLQSSPKSKLEELHETPSQSTLSDPPLSILLRQGRDFKEQTSAAVGSPPHGRSPTPSRISGDPLERGNAKADGQKDCGAKWHLPPLQRAVHRLRRHRARPHQPSGHGRGMAGRSSPQHSGRALVVQRREGIEPRITWIASKCLPNPLRYTIAYGDKRPSFLDQF